jgi:hypothetical protein
VVGILLRPLRAAALALIAGLLLVSAAPSVGGWRTTVVARGSMSPTLRAGDVVVAAPLPAAGARRLSRGTVRLRVPMIGLPVLWVRQRQAVPLLAMSMVLAVLLTPRGRRRRA